MGSTGVPARRSAQLIGAAALAATAVAAAALLYGHGADQAGPGLPSAGPLTAWGLPLVKLAAELSAAVTLGNLLAALFWGERGSPAAARHVRIARLSAALWTASALGVWLLTASDLRALPVSRML